MARGGRAHVDVRVDIRGKNAERQLAVYMAEDSSLIDFINKFDLK